MSMEDKRPVITRSIPDESHHARNASPPVGKRAFAPSLYRHGHSNGAVQASPARQPTPCRCRRHFFMFWSPFFPIRPTSRSPRNPQLHNTRSHGYASRATRKDCGARDVLEIPQISRVRLPQHGLARSMSASGTKAEMARCPVCTENLNPEIVMVKTAEDRV
jgi:hypothetical protein